MKDYLNRGKRRQYSHLAPEILQKLQQVSLSGAFTDLREYLLFAGVANNQRKAYIHANMLSSLASRIEDRCASGQTVDPATVRFQDKELRASAEEEYGIFQAENEGERSYWAGGY